ncbi:hypothetical protein KCU81_g7293, partial [Aureobasidium melanogenum]
MAPTPPINSMFTDDRWETTSVIEEGHDDDERVLQRLSRCYGSSRVFLLIGLWIVHSPIESQSRQGRQFNNHLSRQRRRPAPLETFGGLIMAVDLQR